MTAVSKRSVPGGRLAARARGNSASPSVKLMMGGGPGVPASAFGAGGGELGAEQRTVFFFTLPEGRKGVAGGKAGGVAGVDPGDKGIKGVGEQFRAEVFAKKISQRQVLQTGAAGAEKFAQNAEFGAGGKEA